MGGRGTGSGFRAGGDRPSAAAASAQVEPEISEFHRQQLAQIEANIRRAQLTASLPLSSGDTAYYRRRVLAARRRVAQLTEQYETLEQEARKAARSGIPF